MLHYYRHKVTMYRAMTFKNTLLIYLDTLREESKRKYYVDIPNKDGKKSFTRVIEKLIFVLHK